MLPYLIAGAIGFGIGKLFENGGETFMTGGQVKEEWKSYLKESRVDALVKAGYSRNVARNLSSESWDSLEKQVQNAFKNVLISEEVEFMKGMMESLYTYGGLDKDNKYLAKYKVSLGNKLFNKTFDEYKEELEEGYDVDYGTYTDSEGWTYNSLRKTPIAFVYREIDDPNVLPERFTPEEVIEFIGNFNQDFDTNYKDWQEFNKGEEYRKFEPIMLFERKFEEGGETFMAGGNTGDVKVKSIKKKAEKLLEESISYRWINTDMGSGWSFELESPSNRSVFNVIEQHTYLDEFSPEDAGIEWWDDLSDEDKEYYYEEWKEEFWQGAFQSFKEKCMKHLDDFIEYLQRDSDEDFYAGGGKITDADLNYYIYPTKKVNIAYLGKIQMGNFFSLKDALKEIEYLTKAYPKNEIEKYAIITPDKTFHLGKKEYNIRFDNGGGVEYRIGGEVDKELTIEQTRKIAQETANILGTEFSVTKNSVDVASFDLDLNGEEFEGGSYLIMKNGDVLNVALPNNPVYYNYKERSKNPKMIRTIFEEEYFEDFDNGGEAGMIYLISDNATPKREINISENDILRESKKYFGWRNVSVKRIKSLGSTDYDKFIEFLYKKGYGKDEYAGGGLVVKNDSDLQEVAKYMTNAVKKHRWDLKDLIHYFEQENNFDYKKRVKIWEEMNGYEMPKTYNNIYEMLKRISEANGSKFADGGQAVGGVAKKRRRSASIQYGRSDTAVDKTRVGKPVGYRFSNAKANQLRKDPYAKPTEAQVKKYLGKGIYKENRKNRSDIDRNEKL